MVVELELLNLGLQQLESYEHQARSSAKPQWLQTEKAPLQSSSANKHGIPTRKRLNEICDETGEYLINMFICLELQ